MGIPWGSGVEHTNFFLMLRLGPMIIELGSPLEPRCIASSPCCSCPCSSPWRSGCTSTPSCSSAWRPSARRGVHSCESRPHRPIALVLALVKPSLDSQLLALLPSLLRRSWTCSPTLIGNLPPLSLLSSCLRSYSQFGRCDSLKAEGPKPISSSCILSVHFILNFMSSCTLGILQLGF
jgi:hypothetical protein